MIITVSLLVLFIIYTLLLILLSKNKNFSYVTVILSILIPVIFNAMTVFSYIFTKFVILSALYDLVHWMLLSALNIVAVCIIYKTISKSEHSLLTILVKDFKIMNIVSLLCIIGGIVIIIVSHISGSSFSTEVSVTSLLSSFSNFSILMRLLTLSKRILTLLIPLSLMFPAVLSFLISKKNEK